MIDETITAGLLDDLDAMLDDELTSPIESAHTVRELFALLDRRDFETNDRVLHSLMSRLNEDPQVRRLLLHAMRPTLCSLALKHFNRSHAAMSTADALCTTIDVFYDVLDNPHIRAKKTRVAARITGQLRTELNRVPTEEYNRNIESWDNILVLEAAMEEEHSHSALATTAHDSQMDLLEGLAWAREKNVITLDEARFLVAVYSPDAGVSLTADLDLGDLSPAAIRKRASRLAQRIAQAVTAERDLSSDLSSWAA